MIRPRYPRSHPQTSSTATLKSVLEEQNSRPHLKPAGPGSSLEQDNPRAHEHLRSSAKHTSHSQWGLAPNPIVKLSQHFCSETHTETHSGRDTLILHIKTIRSGQFEVGFSEKGRHLGRKTRKKEAMLVRTSQNFAVLKMRPC